MKCYVCRHDGAFGEIRKGLDGLSLNGLLNGEQVEDVRIYVCPRCGSIHTDMNRSIQDPCRIPNIKKKENEIEKNLTMDFY